MSEAYINKGEKAYRLGKPRTSNPYNFITTRKGHLWDDGWLRGRSIYIHGKWAVNVGR